jgi:hypothetical protein
MTVSSVNGQTGNVWLDPADIEAVPQAQSIAVPSGTPGTVGVPTWTVQPTGTTNALAPFQDIFLKGAYQRSGGDADTEMIYSWGYNPWQIALPGEAAIYNSIHPDAGDTDVSGARGIEWLLTFHTPTSGEVHAIEVVGVKDDTATMNVTFRHGQGADSSGTDDPSGIYFANHDDSVYYMTMTASGGVQFLAPVGFQVAGNGMIAANATGSNAFQVLAQGGNASMQVVSSAGQGILQLSGTTATASTASFQFQYGQTSVWSWDLDHYYGANYFGLTDRTNAGRLHVYFTPGADANAATTTFASQVIVQDNLVVSPGEALSTTATSGFLFLPVCPGTPAGTPASIPPGTAAVVYDSVNNKLNVNSGSGWKEVTLS